MKKEPTNLQEAVTRFMEFLPDSITFTDYIEIITSKMVTSPEYHDVDDRTRSDINFFLFRVLEFIRAKENTPSV